MGDITLQVTISADSLINTRHDDEATYNFWPAGDSNKLNHLDVDWPEVRRKLREKLREHYPEEFEEEMCVYLKSDRRGEGLELKLGEITINKDGDLLRKNLTEINNVNEFWEER